MTQVDARVTEQIVLIENTARQLDALMRERDEPSLYKALVLLQSASGRALNLLAKASE